MLGGSPFVGKVFDDYGPRYLLAVGTFLHVFGIHSMVQRAINLLTRARLDDDIDLYQVLPIPSGSGSLLSHRSINGVLPSFQLCGCLRRHV